MIPGQHPNPLHTMNRRPYLMYLAAQKIDWNHAGAQLLARLLERWHMEDNPHAFHAPMEGAHAV